MEKEDYNGNAVTNYWGVNKLPPILHAAIPNNSYILQELDPRFGQLKIGYIKGHVSWTESSLDAGLDKIETVRRRTIEWGHKSHGRSFLAWTETIPLQEIFDRYGDFTIKEMDIYFLWDVDLNSNGEKSTYVVILPFSTLSFKPSYATKIFGEIPSQDLRQLIKTKIRKANLPDHIRKRIRDTWLMNSAPISTIPPDKLNENFYKFVLGKNIMGFTVHTEKTRTFTGREFI